MTSAMTGAMATAPVAPRRTQIPRMSRGRAGGQMSRLRREATQQGGSARRAGRKRSGTGEGARVPEPTRRAALAAWGAILAAGALEDRASAAEAEGDAGEIPVSSLPKGARNAQTQGLLDVIKSSVRANVTEPADKVAQLALLDAVTYDKSTKSGGANGSIRFPEELKAMGVEGLKPALDQIGKAKAQVEKEWNYPITMSWADMIALSGYYKLKDSFNQTLASRATDPQSGNVIIQAYANELPVPVLGRADADKADPTTLSTEVEPLARRAMEAGLTAGQVSVLAVAFPSGGTVEQVEEQLMPLDKKFGFYVKSYRQSRKELTQTTYQVDAGAAYIKLTTLGAKVDPNKYFHAIPKASLPKKL